MEADPLQAKRLQSVPVTAQTSITELGFLFGVKAWSSLFQGPVLISEAAAWVNSTPFDLVEPECYKYACIKLSAACLRAQV